MTLKVADLFCGAGGTTAGAEAAGAKCLFALNHWDVAVETHAANFPHTKHVNSRLDQVSPGECPKIDLLFASPECTHHSRARGGKPTSDQQRSGAWEVMRWLDYHRPARLVVENVAEFEQWGPVGKDGRPLTSKSGHTFQAWVKAIESYGYRVEWRRLNAADFGAATSRSRLFVLARKGNRAPEWPQTTHEQHARPSLFGHLKSWRAAAEIIDWSIPCPSVFLRRNPLKPKTLARIEAGLRKFVGPILVAWDNHGGNGNYVRSVNQPAWTFVTKANQGVAIPFRVVMRNNMDAADLVRPVGTLTSGGGHNGLAVPFLANVNHDGDPRLAGLESMLGTVTAKNGRAIAVPFVTTYYANGKPYPIEDPLCTLSTRDRCGLAVAIIECAPSIEPRSDAERQLLRTMSELGVVDVGFRMLQNHELSAAQGFESSYIFRGKKAQVTRQIGNSVSPPVARAITEALAG